MQTSYEMLAFMMFPVYVIKRVYVIVDSGGLNYGSNDTGPNKDVDERRGVEVSYPNPEVDCQKAKTETK